MAKFRITYVSAMQQDPEEVEAEKFLDQGEWITFIGFDPNGRTRQVLRVRSGSVERIDRVSG